MPATVKSSPFSFRASDPHRSQDDSFLAPKTVRNRMTAMLAKLGVTTREDAIALGVAGGLGA